MTSPTEEQDREEILRISKKWWDANLGLDIDALKECFPTGDNFLMFNLNSFAYFGTEQVETLWAYLKKHFPYRTKQTVRVMRMHISGDLAYVACEITTSKGGVTTASRDTEVFHRDNGEGKPEWRMWHFHSSALQFDFAKRPEFTEDVPRLAFGDTLADRGVGGYPGHDLVFEYNSDLAELRGPDWV